MKNFCILLGEILKNLSHAVKIPKQVSHFRSLIRIFARNREDCPNILQH